MDIITKIFARRDLTMREVKDISELKDFGEYVQTLLVYCIPVLLILILCGLLLLIYGKILNKGTTSDHRKLMIGLAALCMIVCIGLTISMSIGNSKLFKTVNAISDFGSQMREMDDELADLEEIACKTNATNTTTATIVSSINSTNTTNTTVSSINSTNTTTTTTTTSTTAATTTTNSTTKSTSNITSTSNASTFDADCQAIKDWKAVTKSTVDKNLEMIPLALFGGNVAVDILFVIVCLLACTLIILAVLKGSPTALSKGIALGIVALILAFMVAGFTAPAIQFTMDVHESNTAFKSSTPTATAGGSKITINEIIKLLLKVDTKSQKDIIDYLLTCKKSSGVLSIYKLCEIAAKTAGQKILDKAFCKKHKNETVACIETMGTLQRLAADMTIYYISGGVAAGVGVLLLILLIVLCRRRKRKAANEKKATPEPKPVKPPKEKKKKPKKDEPTCPALCDVCPKKFKKCGVNISLDCGFHIFKP